MSKNVHPSMPGSVANVAFQTGVLVERKRILEVLQRKIRPNGWIEESAEDLLDEIEKGTKEQ